MAEDVSFLEQFDGDGLEALSAHTTTPLLLVAQPLSQVVTGEQVKAGHFYNSVTGEDLGAEITLCVIDFTVAWNVWRPNQGGFVGRVKPHSIAVTGDVYTGMTDSEGNKVIETFMYLVIVKDRPDLGYMLYSGTPGTARFLKQWNTMLFNSKTPGGKKAPIFAKWWSLSLNKAVNKAGQPYYAPALAGKATMRPVGYIAESEYKAYVAPAREIALLAQAGSAVAELEAPQDDTAESSTTQF